MARPEGSDDEFERLKFIAALTRSGIPESIGRERLIKFLDEFDHSSPESAVVDALCARFGLYPYMSNRDDLATSEAMAVEFHSPAELESLNFTFHSHQQAVYQRLMDGENVILSAPTSFGKSAILDALIASGRWATLVIIVPTDALIDETRRRLARFSDEYSIVTHPRQLPGEKTVYVLTQERYLELPSVPDVDLFMIDEFYKLSQVGQTEPNDNRRALLNVAWRELRETGAQFYLTGPNVGALSEAVGEDLRSALIVSDFATVHVEVDDRSGLPDSEMHEDLIRLLSHIDGPTLIFTGTPEKANARALELAGGRDPHPFARSVAQWIATEFSSEWDVVSALDGGVGVHSGPLMGGLQRMMIRLFDEQFIPTLVCTSTIIEGVNTVAKNVVIYEKKLRRHPIDFFTFSNIKGRAGRMTHHFVGRVITYAEPPDRDELEVDIPIESQSASASLATLIQLPPQEWSDDARRRMAHVLQQEHLAFDVLKANRGVDPERQIEVAKRLRSLPAQELDLFVWTGMPTHAQETAVLTLIYEDLATVRAGMNPRIMIGMLSNFKEAEGDIARVIAGQMAYKRRDQTRSDVVTSTLQFQRGWMGFTLPSGLRALQAIVNAVLQERNRKPRTNYQFFISQLENSFAGANLRELEEYGMPFPLALKLHRSGFMQGETPDEMLLELKAASQRGALDLGVVEQWVVDDVLAGFTG